MIKNTNRSRLRPEPTTFNAKDAARHAEAMRQAHLRTLLPHYKQCTTDKERNSFRGLISRDDFAELERLAREES